jgi:hypothetical protein
MKPFLLLILSGLFLVACATPYQKDNMFFEGYSDFEMPNHQYSVAFQGNGNTDQNTVRQYWYRRSAEICGGINNFDIIESGIAGQGLIKNSFNENGVIWTNNSYNPLHPRWHAQGVIQCKK